MTNAGNETLLRLGEAAVRERHAEARRHALAHAATPRRSGALALLARLLRGRDRVERTRRASGRTALARRTDACCEACA